MDTWVGVIAGTNHGHLTCELEVEGGRVVGRLTVVEQTGLTYSASVEGTLIENHLKATLSDFKPGVDGLPTAGGLQGSLSPNGCEVEGDWQTNAGTHGTFRMCRAQPPALAAEAAPATPTTAAPAPQPVAFVTKTISLPSCRLEVQGLAGLLHVAQQGTTVLRPSFTITHRGRTLIKSGIEAFTSDRSLPHVIYDMSITFNEATEGRGYRAVVINLKKHEPNSLFVFGTDGTWVEGKCAEVKAYLQDYQTRIGYLYRQHGLWINSILFLGMLAVLPSVPTIRQRLLFVGLMGASLVGLVSLHRLVMPSSKVYLIDPPPALWRKGQEAIVGTVVATVGAGILAFLSYLFTGGLSDALKWLGIQALLQSVWILFRPLAACR